MLSALLKSPFPATALLFFILPFLLAACAGETGEAYDFTAAEKTSSAGEDFVHVYHLGPADVVKVNVYEEPELSGEFRVDGSGTIAFPLVGAIKIGGMTPSDAAVAIDAALRDGFMRDPKVSVGVAVFRPFYMLGEIHAPGAYAFHEGVRVINAVAVAGGFTGRADNKRVKIVRSSGAEPELLVSGMYAYLLPGDVVYVEKKSSGLRTH